MQEKDFVAFEYKTKTVKSEEQSRVADLYEAFGWEVSKVTPEIAGNVTVVFRRDRRQKHKQELVKLERQAESVFVTIGKLNKAKTAGANIFGFVFGIVSALILGGGMSLTMLNSAGAPAFAGGVVLGALGIILCAINYPIYKKIAEKNTARVLPAIDDSEEKLANLMEAGNDLLKADIV